MELERFLQKKGLEYAPFDPQRAPRLLKTFSDLQPIKCQIIHVVGTNGKGSVGRFLSLLLHQRGFKVGHFTSPHLLHLNERFWLNGKSVSKEILEEAFCKFGEESLQEASYFEVLTFLALDVFKDCQYLVCEAGLGGEFDSTSTCTNPVLTLFTTIGLDHQNMLGDSLEAIARTKLNTMCKKAILGFQNYPIVEEIAREIAYSKNTFLEILEPKDIMQCIKAYCKKNAYPKYQEKNLALAYRAFRALGFDGLDLPMLDLEGRMQQFYANVWLDVAHNIEGAKAILEHFNKDKYILVYNSYEDKEVKEILQILKPIIQRVEILELNHPRVIKKKKLEGILHDLKISYKDFSNLEDDKKYLVCGSFSVVGEFLRRFR